MKYGVNDNKPSEFLVTTEKETKLCVLVPSDHLSAFHDYKKQELHYNEQK
jgi:hypothetical protein